MESKEVLNEKYIDIIKCINNILTIAGIDKDYLENQLNNGKLLQTELDYSLLELIDTIKK